MQLLTKKFFKLIQDNKLWMGYGFSNGNAYFKTPHIKEFAAGVFDEAHKPSANFWRKRHSVLWSGTLWSKPNPTKRPLS